GAGGGARQTHRAPLSARSKKGALPSPSRPATPAAPARATGSRGITARARAPLSGTRTHALVRLHVPIILRGGWALFFALFPSPSGFAEMVPPVQVSPLIKFTRYSALLVGMLYGKKRYDYLKPVAEEERRIESEEKKKREELERIAKELAEASEDSILK
uniref:ATP synthase F(0) complex subunit e, mitochondrial n=2 Tax=Chrysemys picta bellii TaxID=8478 RepID=A0A8C3ICC2_CHRPI